MPSDARLLLLDKNAVDGLLVADEVLHAVRESFELHSDTEGRVFPVIREKLSNGGIFGVKAGAVQSQMLLGLKAAGYWPGNRTVGAAPHQATILLFDPSTGRPTCIIDGNAVTTVRTGAAGALGIRALARTESESLTIFGTGVQARSQLSFALRTAGRVRHVRYLSEDGRPDLSFEAEFGGTCELECAGDPNDAVASADIVITATPGGGPLFEARAVRPGTHLNCVGADTRGKRELPEGILAAARVVADDRTQARQIGELQWAPDAPCVEFGDLLTGRASLDRGLDEITIFDMTGLALQDLAVARLLFNKASTACIGTTIAWPW